MASSGKSIAATVVTIIVALAAAAAVFFVIWTAGKQQEQEQEHQQEVIDQGFQPTQEMADEMKQAATDLLKGNYEVFQLFYTKGTSYQQEPYNNLPEDGFYTCANEKYPTYADVEAFVKSIYVEDEAERILTTPRSSSNPKIDGPVYGDDDGVLGLSMEFVNEDGFIPVEYSLSWSNPTFTIEPISEMECGLSIILKDQSGSDVEIRGNMLKVNGEWRLEKIVF